MCRISGSGETASPFGNVFFNYVNSLALVSFLVDCSLMKVTLIHTASVKIERVGPAEIFNKSSFLFRRTTRKASLQLARRLTAHCLSMLFIPVLSYAFDQISSLFTIKPLSSHSSSLPCSSIITSLHLPILLLVDI